MPVVALPQMPPPAANPNDYAIVVGINHYHPAIGGLDGAINDCDLFCHWLTGPDMGGLDPANVTYFQSANGQVGPIRNEIENRLTDFYDLANTTGTPCGRRLYLFFAGHGLVPPPPDTRGCALLMADAREILLRGLLGLKAANAMRTTGLFQEVMLVMDCCAEVSGQNELECFLPYYGDTALAAQPFTHIQAAPLGKTTTERLLDHPFKPGEKIWHGVLTNALLRGLTTAADPNGNVTAASLKTFLEAAEGGGPHVDHSTGAAGAVMTFGRAIGVPVDVTLNNGATRFQVREGNNFTVVIPPRAPSQIRLAPGQYLFDAFGNVGNITNSIPVSVREGGMNVQL